jgi:hypothetical protein
MSCRRFGGIHCIVLCCIVLSLCAALNPVWKFCVEKMLILSKVDHETRTHYTITLLSSLCPIILIIVK